MNPFFEDDDQVVMTAAEVSRSKLARAAEAAPTLYAFGLKPLRVLTAAEEATAPFEQRLCSCWRYLVKRAKRFAAVMGERERASYNAEDLIQEIVLKLLQKDSKWEPSRGRYCTFADRVARSVLIKKRESARVVRAPANAMCTLKEARKRLADGTITAKRAATAEAIGKLFGETEVCSPGFIAPVVVPANLKPSRELIEAVKTMRNPIYALVVARSHGLFGNLELTPDELAKDLGVDARRARYLQGAARSSLKDRIQRLRAQP